MPLYVTNELAFEIPDDEPFADRTTHELDAPLGGDAFLSLLVDRAPLAEGATLDAAVDEHVTAERRRLAMYELTERREVTVSGRASVEVRALWGHRGVRYYVRELHVGVGARRLAFSATAPVEKRQPCDAYVDQLAKTLDLGGS